MGHDVGRNLALTWNGISLTGVREKGIACNGEPVNVTADEDAGWQTLLTVAGEQNVELSISGVVRTRALANDWWAGNRTRAVVITFPNGAILSFTGYLATYNEAAPYQDAITFDATIQSTGTPTFVPGVD